MALAEGSVLDGRYRVLRQLGEGGMGSVYQVEDLARPSAVWVLKVLLDDTTASPEDAAWARRRFDDEIALMRTLAHPRIPRFCEALVEGGRRCFVMEFIPGVTLEERLAATHAPLPERDVLRWLIAVCDVLTYLHGR
ncbi:MAG TPA: protein kinase, partial [Ktedonobacterales bacterium]|nr:protein kinase [Ktedonobacterales bacterium]